MRQLDERMRMKRGSPGGVVAALVGCGLFASAAVGEAQGLVSPMRIAEGPPGQVLVSDSRQDLVLAVDESTLAPVWSFPVTGTPMAVGFAANLVFIGNASTHNVEVYRLKGAPKGPDKTLEFQFNLGHTPAGTAGTIRTPSDLSVDKNANLVFVLDSGERRVKVFDLDGNAVAVLPPAAEPQLFSPTGIAIDPARQEVLVSDYGDPNGSLFSGAVVPARLLIYSYAGALVSRIEGRVTNPAHAFQRPQGLAVDGLGHIYMVECVRGEVFVFDRFTGAVVRTLGAFGDGPGQLSLPLDVVLQSRTNDLLVTNSMLGRIEVFRDAGAR